MKRATPPVPGSGEVLLRVRRIGVCGSDVHANHGRHPFTGNIVCLLDSFDFEHDASSSRRQWACTC